MTEIEVISHIVHEAGEELEGMTTYRVYAVFENSTDQVSAVYGDFETPLRLSSTSGFYNNILATGATASGINPVFFQYPGLEGLSADSWLTIGIESMPVGYEVSISTVDDPGQPYFDAFVTGTDIDGDDVIINTKAGGMWYVLPDAPNGFAGADMKVLLAQVTIPTEDDFEGVFNVQIFLDGDQNQSQTYAGVGFSSNAAAVFGCTDSSAVNFDPIATNDGFSCVYPCDVPNVQINSAATNGRIDLCLPM